LNSIDLSLSLSAAPSSDGSTTSTTFTIAEEYAHVGVASHDFAGSRVGDHELSILPCIPELFPDHACNTAPLTIPENAFTDEHHRTLPDDDFSLSKEDLLAEIALFTDEAYECYPILHLHSLIKSVEEEKHLSDPEFRTLALSIVMMNEARRFRRFPRHGAARLDSLFEAIQNIRLNSDHYHFADSPSLDTVTVSWCLFMANIFRGRFYKAFAFLTEAIGFLDLIDFPSDPLESAKLRRVEYMLYITESGAISLYGPSTKRRIARWPSNCPDSVDDLLFYHHREDHVPSQAQHMAQVKMATLDRQAVELLLMMARLHAASGPDEVANVTVDERLMATMAGSFGKHAEKRTAISEQTADVAITRQWKLGWHWRTRLAEFGPLIQHRTSLNYTVQILGMTTLQWGKTLLPGSLRLIGLGKIVALADAILYVSSAIGEHTSSANIIGDLIRTVSEVDYERNYAAQLCLLESSIMTVSPLINLNEIHGAEVLGDTEIDTDLELIEFRIII
jgi:hypothetical protein